MVSPGYRLVNPKWILVLLLLLLLMLFFLLPLQNYYSEI